jgi:hypothetical protein
LTKEARVVESAKPDSILLVSNALPHDKEPETDVCSSQMTELLLLLPPGLDADSLDA